MISLPARAETLRVGGWLAPPSTNTPVVLTTFFFSVDSPATLRLASGCRSRGCVPYVEVEEGPHSALLRGLREPGVELRAAGALPPRLPPVARPPWRSDSPRWRSARSRRCSLASSGRTRSRTCELGPRAAAARNRSPAPPPSHPSAARPADAHFALLFPAPSSAHARPPPPTPKPLRKTPGRSARSSRTGPSRTGGRSWAG